MTGIIAVLAAGSGLDAVSLSATWSDVTDDIGAPLGGTNEDRTLTWVRGSTSRNISCNYTGSETLQYRINSGAYTAYSVAFALTSGQTLGWKYIAAANESGTITVTDDARGAAIDAFTYSATGW